MALILHIETTTNVCSVAIAEDDNLLALKETHESQMHSKMLGVYIQEVLHTANISISNLQAVAVSEGPGSYTGLRIGVSVAKGICFASNLPLIGVSTLR